MDNEIEIPELSELATSVWNSMPHFIGEERIGNPNGLNIFINANDHNPPHFHVMGGGVDACFSVSDGTLIKGYPGYSTIKIVNKFYSQYRDKIQQVSDKYREKR